MPILPAVMGAASAAANTASSIASIGSQAAQGSALINAAQAAQEQLTKEQLEAQLSKKAGEAAVAAI